MVLAAYATGLPAVVLIRSAVASFYSREDTKTPLVASLSGVAVNVLAKLALMAQMGVAGLALGTAFRFLSYKHVVFTGDRAGAQGFRRTARLG